MHFKDSMIWTNDVSELGNPKWSVRNKSHLNSLELSAGKSSAYSELAITP